MSTSAEQAWQNERKAHPRAAYIAGYERGQDEAATKIADLIEGNVGLLESFAGARTPDLIVHLLRHLSADEHSAASAAATH